MEPILQIRHLQKTYERGREHVRALSGVSFDVAEGEFVSIVGRSGCGKSTLLNIIGGLDVPSSGSVVVRGRNLAAMSRSELAGHRRSTVGMVFQSFNLIPSRTAVENVALPLAFSGVPRKNRPPKAARLLTGMGLKSRLNHVPSEMSGGEAQRVAVARALVNDPVLLLADEPTGNLDSRTAGEILDLLKALNRERGLTVVMVSHDEASARRVSHRLVRLLDGRIQAQVRLRRPA
ncbi:ABC transporter ATP-binding protein [bacterium]|nr:ABC transporter ATP-binding protein [bacterium]